MKRDILFEKAWATFSDEVDAKGKPLFRYDLGRVWDPSKPLLGWVACNPSSAGVDDLDPTTWRMVEFSMKFGYGGFWLGNVYGLVSTDPAGLWAAKDPVGPGNDAFLATIVKGTTGMVAAWGKIPKRDRVYDVTKLLEHVRRSTPGQITSLWCLRMTTGKLPQPEHPLYLPGRCERIPFGKHP